MALYVVRHHIESIKSVDAFIDKVDARGDEGRYLLLSTFDACLPPWGGHIGNPSASVSTIRELYGNSPAAAIRDQSAK